MPDATAKNGIVLSCVPGGVIVAVITGINTGTNAPIVQQVKVFTPSFQPRPGAVVDWTVDPQTQERIMTGSYRR